MHLYLLFELWQTHACMPGVFTGRLPTFRQATLRISPPLWSDPQWPTLLRGREFFYHHPGGMDETFAQPGGRRYKVVRTSVRPGGRRSSKIVGYLPSPHYGPRYRGKLRQERHLVGPWSRGTSIFEHAWLESFHERDKQSLFFILRLRSLSLTLLTMDYVQDAHRGRFALHLYMDYVYLMLRPRHPAPRPFYDEGGLDLRPITGTHWRDIWWTWPDWRAPAVEAANRLRLEQAEQASLAFDELSDLMQFLV